jgi:hypothetical protein
MMMTNIEEYFRKLKQDIETKQLSNEDGGSKEQIFTRYATDLLKLKGETDNVSVSYDEKSGGKQPHKINAFALSDDSSTFDMFVTKYFPESKPKGMTDADVEKLIMQIKNFYEKAKDPEFILSIAESSEIFDCAHIIAHDEDFSDNLSKIRIFILTNGYWPEDTPEINTICGTPAEINIIDINHLYDISEEAEAPINVNFTQMGYKNIPCVAGPDSNDVYQVYLAILPGKALADLYRDYGTRLMENNVRQFLQFTGKINKGIKETILTHPEMFLAYNNGISATANSITLNSGGHNITNIENLQIVNGGQTTASLYHTLIQNPNADLSRIFVQVKISVIKKDDEYENIVSNISRCANAQNKINETDFSANDDRLIKIEKMSRYITAPETKTQPYATYWYFERAKGQYKNFRLKDGFTRQREQQFDLKYPKTQVFTKTELAKYINSYGEVYNGDKLVIGPHIVCRGNEKCYDAFRIYNLPQATAIDNIYFEDTVAKMILFNDADRRYGTKKDGSPIGDIKKTVVPYAIAVLHRLTEGKIDLYKIWRAQKLSEALSDAIYSLMKQINDFIIKNSPSSRYEEWGKKEDCWQSIKANKWRFYIEDVKDDLIDETVTTKRKSINLSEYEQIDALYDKQYVESIPYEIWEKTAVWGKESGLLSQPQILAAKEIHRKLSQHIELSASDIERGVVIADILAKNNIDLLYQSGSFAEVNILDAPKSKKINRWDIAKILTDDLLERMLEWDSTHHLLQSHTRDNINKVLDGTMNISVRMEYGFYYELLKLEDHGFKR